MHQPSPSETNRIVDVKDIIYSTQQIFKYAEKIRNAYEHLMTRYEKLRIENVELKSPSAKVTVNTVTATNLSHKRRKTDESLIDDSVVSNDPLNEAIQDLSSCVDDEIIESTPKPDVTRKNVSKKILSFKSPKKGNQIKVENFDDSKDLKNEELIDVENIKVEKNPESPLRSVENQCGAGKENRRKNPAKWFGNVMISPSRVSRSGFISTKSPKGVSRLSLSKPYKQSILEFAKKPAKETAVDTCDETFFDGTPRKPIGDVKSKFLRQQCLEACVNSSKDSDDENVFSFKSPVNLNITPSTSPPNIKSEPQTEQVKESSAAHSSIDNNQVPSGSCGSSVVAMSGESPSVVVIEESQPLFEECSETFCDKMELKIQAVESLANELKINDNENVVDNHKVSCRICRLFITSNPHLTMDQKLKLIEKCKYAARPDTDPEYWNPRFLPTPESQKQETLIDDRWATRKKKS